MKKLVIIGISLLLLVVALLKTGSIFALKEYKSDRFMMDTLITIKVYGKEETKLRKAVEEAYNEMQRIADMSDRFPEEGTTACKTSDICRINAQAGKNPVKVHKEVIEMLMLCMKGYKLSKGGFDATIGPLTMLWGFGSEDAVVPSSDKVKLKLPDVGSNLLHIDEKKQDVFLDKVGMKLDLGSVAKGYAAERAAQILQKNGIKKGLIDAGGNIRVIGSNSQNRPWQIGIKDPRKKDALIAILSLKDESAVTSGDYYRYFEADGKRWHHIIDPRTGYPANKNISVTVIAKDAGMADILSTAFFVMNPEEAIKTAEGMAGVEVFLVTSNKKIMHTDGLKGRLELKAGGEYHYDPGR